MASLLASSPVAPLLLGLSFLLSIACSGQATGGVDDSSTGGAALDGSGGSGGAAVGGNAGAGGGGTASGGSAAGGTGAVSGTGGQLQGTGGAPATCENFVPDDCGACSCYDGQIVCTDVYCPPPQCRNGETMDDGCNTCLCSSGTWLCTTRACLTPECEAGQTKDVDCNTCVCDGGYWSCTERVCTPTACGARAGDTCTENEYCAYQDGEYCGAADAEAVCRPRPEACDAVYAPVCGCDGKPYGNDCEAAMAGTGVYQNGSCP